MLNYFGSTYQLDYLNPFNGPFSGNYGSRSTSMKKILQPGLIPSSLRQSQNDYNRKTVHELRVRNDMHSFSATTAYRAILSLKREPTLPKSEANERKRQKNSVYPRPSQYVVSRGTGVVHKHKFIHVKIGTWKEHEVMYMYVKHKVPCAWVPWLALRVLRTLPFFNCLRYVQ